MQTTLHLVLWDVEPLREMVQQARRTSHDPPDPRTPAQFSQSGFGDRLPVLTTAHLVEHRIAQPGDHARSRSERYRLLVLCARQ